MNSSCEEVVDQFVHDLGLLLKRQPLGYGATVVSNFAELL